MLLLYDILHYIHLHKLDGKSDFSMSFLVLGNMNYGVFV